MLDGLQFDIDVIEDRIFIKGLLSVTVPNAHLGLILTDTRINKSRIPLLSRMLKQGQCPRVLLNLREKA